MFEHEYDLKSLQVIVPTGRDFPMYVAPRYIHHYVESDYEKTTADFLARILAKAELFIDVGAHYGFFSLLAASTNPRLRVVAVEPTPETCEILRRNVALSRRDTIELRQAAVSSGAGKAEFIVSVASDNCSFYEHPNAKAIRRIEVPTVSIDDLLKDSPARRVVVKIDTDGHELAVLAGMAESLRRGIDLRLVIEFNPKMQRQAGHEPTALLYELDRLGYAMFLIDDARRRFHRLHPDSDWSSFVNPASYANIYCVAKERALSVVFFAHSAQLGGAERSLIELVDELIADHGAVCTVVAPAAGPLVETVERSGAAAVVADLPWWAFVGDDAQRDDVRARLVQGSRAVCRDLVPLIATIDPDVIFTQTLVIPWGAMAAGVLGKPHVWSVCEYGELDHGFRFADPFQDLLKAIEDGSSLILTFAGIRKTLFGGVDHDRIRTIGRHIPIPDAVVPSPAAWRRPESLRLGLFGNVSEGKGQLEAVQAIGELVRRGRDVELLIAGYTGSQAYLERIQATIDELGLKDRVTIAGFLPEPLPSIAAADVVLVCSRNEAFGRSAVEAMLLGRPVVYARSRGTVEYMEDGNTGLAYAPGNVGELVQCIERLIDDPAKAKGLGEAASRTAQTRFSRDAYGGEVFRLLSRLRAGPRPVDVPRRVVASMAAVIAGDAARIEALSGVVASRESELTEQRTRLVEAHEILAERSAFVAEQKARIAARDADLVALRSDIIARDSTLAERDAHIVSLSRARSVFETEVALLRERVDVLTAMASDSDARAARWSADEAALRTSLSAVYASTSWQVTRPLRAVGRLVFRSGASRAAVTAKPPLRTRLVAWLRYSAVGFPALLAMRAVRQRSRVPLRDWQAARLITGSWLFDRAWYVAFNRDVARTGIDPVRHYVAYGAREGRDPGPSFSTRGYLARNPDVAVAGVNPLAHYLKFGRHEGRVGGYRALPVGLHAATSAPSEGFGLKRLVCGAARGLLPVRVVDRLMLRKVAREVIAPSGLFDATWYRARYPDVRDANVDPLWHYLLTGWREGRDPHPLFSTGFYLDQNADVQASGGNPLVHYLLHGRDEQRLPNRKGGESRTSPRDVASHGSSALLAAVARPLVPAEQREWTQDHFVSPPSRALDYVADRYGVELLPRYRDLFDVVDRHGSGAAGFETGARRALLARAQAAAGETAARQSGADPVASIIIPMFDNVLVTLACIVSILEIWHRTPLEIVVADDQSADPAAVVMGAIGAPVRHLRQPSNLGFLRNCNEAARQARGDFLVFLNNDTLILPGWLDALVDVLASSPKIGLVGSKLLNGDGTLQEAGGIFWRDGSAWNFGRGQDPALPEFNYRKPVDYVSGASMAMRRAEWRELAGFDEAFAPAYCEDADLAFRLRAMGFEVVYQPHSELFHHEGFSHGRETTSGIKANQVTNQRKLFDRWYDVLEAEHFDNGTNVFEARDRSRQRPHILVVDHYVPQWDRDAGSRTMWSYLRLLVRHGFQVTFWPDNLYEDPDYTRALQDIGIEVIYSAAYLDRFPKWFAERAGHIRYVLFSRPHITEKYIDEIKRHRGVRILYYGHDLHYRRIESECRLDPTQRLRDALAVMKELEHGIIYKSDIALYPSHEEVAYLRSTLAPTARVELVPAYVFDEVDLAVGAAAVERIVAMTGAELLFVGGFQHKPNVDGVIWFAKTVMPKLRAAGLGARLNIVGSNITPEIAALAGIDIVVHGRLGDPELAALYETVDLVVAPLRFGGGVKGKIIEAMAKGRPVATTSIGAQGIDDAATMLFVGDEPNDLAGAVLDALTDRAEAAMRAGRALDFIRRRYTVDAVAAVFATFMPELAAQAERSRATP